MTSVWAAAMRRIRVTSEESRLFRSPLAYGCSAPPSRALRPAAASVVGPVPKLSEIAPEKGLAIRFEFPENARLQAAP